MLVAAVDPVLATNTTGHDLTPASAMFEYVDHTRAGCMPGSVVLGGWRPIPYGQLGMGPKPASLKPLEDMAVDMAKVNDLIDLLFRLDSASPPMLWCNGHLRPAVEAAFATMVMYFEERALEGEVGSTP